MASPAWADIDPVSGIDFVRITHSGNAPWMGTNPPTQGVDAIGCVYAGSSFAGNITATGDGSFDPADASTYGSIGRIVVGPDPAAAGTTGDTSAWVIRRIQAVGRGSGGSERVSAFPVGTAALHADH